MKEKQEVYFSKHRNDAFIIESIDCEIGDIKNVFENTDLLTCSSTLTDLMLQRFLYRLLLLVEAIWIKVRKMEKE